ncbi:hypothetical protein [uncultured Phenylobacterium sp.]|uniref:hypothetical protein n=1 Tax=uncultured Phenylobacterium sp. TaxID=349273 RepID=UPI0025D45252|nr:hypothetical protein [uncultured Phenylobacterium sp.]
MIGLEIRTRIACAMADRPREEVLRMQAFAIAASAGMCPFTAGAATGTPFSRDERPRSARPAPSVVLEDVAALLPADLPPEVAARIQVFTLALKARMPVADAACATGLGAVVDVQDDGAVSVQLDRLGFTGSVRLESIH